MRIHPFAIAFLAVGAVSACVSTGPIPVTDSVLAFDAGWASVAPPRGNDWYVFGTNRNTTVYGKTISPTHSFRAVVLVDKIDNCCKDAQDLVASHRAIQEENRKDPRYHIITQEAEATSWDGMVCVSYRIVSQDLGSTIAPGVPLNFFQKSLACLRPGFSGELIELSYSERDGLAEGTPELVAEGESFLKGLKRSQNK